MFFPSSFFFFIALLISIPVILLFIGFTFAYFLIFFVLFTFAFLFMWIANLAILPYGFVLMTGCLFVGLIICFLFKK